jgi:hypothetical protein
MPPTALDAQHSDCREPAVDWLFGGKGWVRQAQIRQRVWLCALAKSLAAVAAVSQQQHTLSDSLLTRRVRAPPRGCRPPRHCRLC